MGELTRSMHRGSGNDCLVEVGGGREGRMTKVAFVAGLRGEKLHATVAGMDGREVLDVLESREVSRVVRIAVVAKLVDVDLLVSAASSDAEPFVRRGALQRLDELQQRHPLSPGQLERLVPCLRQGELLAAAIVLMDSAGFDWCARSDERVADAMCAALYNAQGIMEEVVIDDAFAQLAHCRPDLAGSLRSCSPERFLPQALEPAAPTRTITLVPAIRRDNVA